MKYFCTFPAQMIENTVNITIVMCFKLVSLIYDEF